MTAKPRKVTAWSCRCERCGHEWESVGPTPPERCPGCQARHWERKARSYNKRKPKA